MRRALLAALPLVLVAPAPAGAAVSVPRFVLDRVNAERDVVRAGGTVSLCQAIPYVALAPEIRWRGRSTGLRARVELRGPEGARVVHGLRSPRRAGVRRVVFTSSELPGGAYTEGRWTVRVHAGGRVLARATVHFARPATSTC